MASVIGPNGLAPVAAAGTAVQEPVRFDIPAEPLASALNAYSAITHLSLFYDGSLAVGRTSSPVHGLFTPQEALRRLLGRTDFVAESTDSGTITIGLSDVPSARQLVTLRSRNAGYWPYLALIQSSLRDALCENILTRSDAEDLEIRFWIAPSGSVARAELLTSTGIPERDAAYAGVLQTLDIGQPPPPGMPQPVTMMVLPRPSTRAAGCAAPKDQAAIR